MTMPPLYHGHLIKRYKRFLADIILDNNEIITAHVPNSGAMTSTIHEGCEVWVSYHNDPKRKLKYTLQLTDVGTGFICTNTNHANALILEAIHDRKIPQLCGYTSIKTEQKYGQNSRIDILLSNETQRCYVEIKSVTLKIDRSLAFPDAITTRGTKHLHELIRMKEEGYRAVMLYLAQRDDAKTFRIAQEIDPIYNKTLQEAIHKGVEVLVWQTTITTEAITLSNELLLTL